MRKYTVFVVDDEPLILRGLKRSIEESLEGLTIIGEALNGEDAFLAIQALKPDIVFTDIRMPVMDGIRLLEQIQTLKSCPKTVVVSGYEDFHYVRQALRLGAVDYLLKPVSKRELAGILSPICHELHDQQKKSQYQQLEAWIDGESPLNASQEAWGQAGPPAFTCFLLCAGSYSTFHSSWLTPSADYWLKTDFKATLEDLGVESGPLSHWVLPLPGKNELLLVVSPDSGVKLTDSQARLIGETLKARLNGDELPVSVVIGKASIEALGLPYELQKLKILLSKRAVFGQSVLLNQPYDGNGDLSISPILDTNTEKLMTLFIETEQAGAFKNEVVKLLAKCSERHALQVELERLLKHILQLFSLSGQTPIQSKRQIEMDMEIEELITNAHRYSYVRSSILLLIDDCFRIVSQPEVDTLDNALDQAASYLDAHFTRPISLQALAKQFGISLPHPSTAFKKKKGVPPVEYIARLRIERAKQLLRHNPPFTLKEIGQAIGYEDPYDFSRVFKSMTGTNPSEYRSSE